MTSIKFRALTHNDHKLFFEALGEHGKDFQNIQQYMAQKCGKSNKSSEQNKSIDPQERREQDKKEEDKKREQIRNFYNKLYGKLSQLVGKLDDRIEKVNQELYLLINYGEIWKKHGFKFNNKTKKLLEELVHQGYTTLRFKNKNVRLRTPPCKALKKINEIGVDEKVKMVTTRELPKDVIVEFHPATNRDWLKVQSISQNPLARAKLSIQKRLSHILEFLENKWNVSQDKLNRTVDVWLKVAPNNLSIEDNHPQHYPPQNNNSNSNANNASSSTRTENPNSAISDGGNSNQNQSSSNNDVHLRLRLRPSSQHELKEVNITRVVPDNHLDLSLNAYIRRLGESIPQISEQASSKNHTNKDASSSQRILLTEGAHVSDNLELSQGGMSSSSRLPVSLTTPDSSILLERSSTSDQPSIAQARKNLNLLQTLANSFEGCENSRTACEDTQDRSLLVPSQSDINRTSGFGRGVSFADESSRISISRMPLDNLPALFDEDASIDPALQSSHEKTTAEQLIPDTSNQRNIDCQNSKSVDFHIPNNVILADWFKMSGQEGGDDANDAFSSNQTGDDNKKDVGKDVDECTKTKVEPNGTNPPSMKPHNQMIEIEKFAEGWTRQDDTSMTIGELYLAFKCPDKIVLEYEFEQFTYNSTDFADNLLTQTSTEQLEKTGAPAHSTSVVPENKSNNTLIFKLLTAASLSLAHIERQKQEQQHKLHDQPCSKLKRRKGQGQAMTLRDIETTNQRVEEALKQLQPTRLSVFRRAR